MRLSKTQLALPTVWSDHPGAHAYGGHVPIRSILLIKPDHIGDLILGLDAFMVVRRAFPEAQLTLACGPWNADIARSLGIFDDVHPIDFFNPKAERGFDGFVPGMLNGLPERRFDLAVDMRVDPETRIILRHVDATYKCGYESPHHHDVMTFFLPHQITREAERNLGMHQGLLMLRLAHSVVDLFRAAPETAALLRDRIAQLPAAIDLSFATGRPLVAVNTGSGRLAKNWPSDRFAELVRWLSDQMDVAVLLLGTKDQVEEYDGIVGGCRAQNVVSVAGRSTLREAIGLIGQASMYVGNDTGLTHVAARLGLPTIAIFSGIDPTGMWAAVGPDVTIVKAPVPCSPCHILKLADCHHGHACIRAIDVGTIRNAIRLKLLRCEPFGGRPPPVARPAASALIPAA